MTERDILKHALGLMGLVDHGMTRPKYWPQPDNYYVCERCGQNLSMGTGGPERTSYLNCPDCCDTPPDKMAGK